MERPSLAARREVSLEGGEAEGEAALLGPGGAALVLEARVAQAGGPGDLIGRLAVGGVEGALQVAAVVNFPPRQIGPFMSEVLTLGVPDAAGEVMLVRPEGEVPKGGRLY